MSKYSRALKCILAKQCLAGVSSTLFAKQYSISSRQIRYWAQYSTAIATLKTLNLMWTKGWFLTHTSAVLNLSSPGILSVWLQKHRDRGIKGLETQRLGLPFIHEASTSTSPEGRFLTNFILYVIYP
nr:helix-turn-helix domain-containing protein [Photobacterium iliopiscarium]